MSRELNEKNAFVLQFCEVFLEFVSINSILVHKFKLQLKEVNGNLATDDSYNLYRKLVPLHKGFGFCLRITNDKVYLKFSFNGYC